MSPRGCEAGRRFPAHTCIRELRGDNQRSQQTRARIAVVAGQERLPSFVLRKAIPALKMAGLNATKPKHGRPWASFAYVFRVPGIVGKQCQLASDCDFTGGYPYVGSSSHARADTTDPIGSSRPADDGRASRLDCRQASSQTG